MELRETIKYMQSSEYQDRFKAEYYQLKIRIEKLEKTIDNYKNDIKVELSCPIDILVEQLIAMEKYLFILKDRAKIENINIEEC